MIIMVALKVIVVEESDDMSDKIFMLLFIQEHNFYLYNITKVPLFIMVIYKRKKKYNKKKLNK